MMEEKWNTPRDMMQEPIYIPFRPDVAAPADIRQVICRDHTGEALFPAQNTRKENAEGIVMIATAEKGCDKTLIPVTAPAPELPDSYGVQLIFQENEQTLQVLINGRLFTSYVYDSRLVKPYLGPIFNSAGGSYTRVDPTAKEHPHHRSVFLGVGEVNGVDFWNEHGNYGYQKHMKFSAIKSGPAFGTFTAENTWQDAAGKPLIDESRTFTFYNQTPDCRYIDMMIRFTAAYEDVVFGQTKEAGPLGVRMNDILRADRGGHFTNSYGALNESECWGRSAVWCDYRGILDGRTCGVAVFDHQSNERHPTAWHIRNYGLFAPNNLYFKGGFTIVRGETVTYRYRLCFYEGDRTDIGSRYLIYANYANL